MIKYSFPPISHSEVKILILGTMPGEMSLRLNQYYGHKQNAFWKIIFTLFEEPFSDDYETRKNVLLKKNIAVWDVLQACQCEGSSDNNIKNELPNDFETFFQNHPEIKYIAFNGQNAEKYFRNYIKTTRDFTFITLPSTSPANSRKSFEEKLEKWEILKTGF